MSPRRQSPHAPSEDERLLLRAALLDGDDAVEAWERTKHVADDVRRVDRATYRLLPLLYRNLERLGVDDPLMGTLKGVYRHSWYCNQRLFHEAAEAIRALEAGGVETMVIKGAALSVLHYRDPGARPMEDLDVVVRNSSALDAMRVLEEAGWHSEHPSPIALRMRVEHSTELADTNGREADLHWYPLFVLVPELGFWERSVPVSIGEEPTRALCATDELFCTIVHGLGWYPAPIGWISDSVTIARSDIDWDALAGRAERWSLTARLHTGLALLAKDFAVPVPPSVLERLSAAPKPLPERAAHRALLRGQQRGLPVVLHWDRYNRMRPLGAGEARGGLPGYMRDAILWGSWLTPLRVVKWRLNARTVSRAA
jgi:hypothetical protein